MGLQLESSVQLLGLVKVEGDEKGSVFVEKLVGLVVGGFVQQVLLEPAVLDYRCLGVLDFGGKVAGLDWDFVVAVVAVVVVVGWAVCEFVEPAWVVLLTVLVVEPRGLVRKLEVGVLVVGDLLVLGMLCFDFVGIVVYFVGVEKLVSPVQDDQYYMPAVCEVFV